MSTPFLAIDIGNSNVKAARYDGKAWGDSVVIPSGEDLNAGLELLLAEKIRCGVASVVPERTTVIQKVCPESPFVVRADGALPFAMAYKTPTTLGADRLAAAAGAWLVYGKPAERPVLALTAGTALTLTAVDLQGGQPVLLGGAILPGPKPLERALGQGTAQLPSVEFILRRRSGQDSILPEPPPTIGTTTEESIQVGIDASLFDAAAAVIKRASEALSAHPIVIATGGWAHRLSERTGLVDRVDTNLVFEGVRQLALLDQTVGNAK